MLTAYARSGPGRSTSVPAITLLNTTDAWVFAEDPIKPNATQAIVHLGLAQLERLILTLDENTLADTGMIVGFAVAARINPLVARARHVDNLGRFELGLLRGGRGHHGGLHMFGFHYVKRAARLGSDFGAMWLGHCYFYDLRNYDRAHLWFMKVAEGKCEFKHLAEEHITEAALLVGLLD